MYLWFRIFLSLCFEFEHLAYYFSLLNIEVTWNSFIFFFYEYVSESIVLYPSKEYDETKY